MGKLSNTGMNKEKTDNWPTLDYGPAMSKLSKIGMNKEKTDNCSNLDYSVRRGVTFSHSKLSCKDINFW